MITLARNLYFFGSRFFTGLTAVFITCLHEAPAWYMRAIDWLIRGHPTSPCLSIFCFLSDIRVERLWRMRSTRYRRNLYRDGSDPTEKNQNHNDKKRQT
ncbi:MAG: hypothetical protein ABSC33_03985 [Candidatus Sulfotelmatobacter sp.]